MKTLNIEELTVEQKIGQLLMVRGFIDEADREFIYHMMENHSVGAIQIPADRMDYKKEIEEVKRHADYPILIFTDMERGFPVGDYRIPSAMGLSITGDEELAYQFGAVTGIMAKDAGYNLVGGPVVDLIEGDNMLNFQRSFGEDIENATRMTSAVLRGEMDQGVIGIMKHWPMPSDLRLDSHVYAEVSQFTEKDLLESTIVPYLHAIRYEKLSAVMTTHTYLPKIDDIYPASLSEKIIGILRSQGFDGLMITDSFAMLGILQKFGEEQCYGLSVKAGHDLVLPNYRVSFKTAYEYLLNSYKTGVFSEERLNDAVRRVLTAQNATLNSDEVKEVSEYQKECFRKIEKDSICLIKDADIATALEKDKKNLFVLIKANEYKDDCGVPYEITNVNGIDEDNIQIVKQKILDRFPGSLIESASQHPCPYQVEAVCKAAIEADNIVFITFSGTGAYSLGGEFTPRILHLMKAVKDKLAAIIHIGNPYPLEAVPHIPRTIISVGGRESCIDRGLSVLNGEYEPKGKLPFTLKLR